MVWKSGVECKEGKQACCLLHVAPISAVSLTKFSRTSFSSTQSLSHLVLSFMNTNTPRPSRTVDK